VARPRVREREELLSAAACCRFRHASLLAGATCRPGAGARPPPRPLAGRASLLALVMLRVRPLNRTSVPATPRASSRGESGGKPPHSKALRAPSIKACLCLSSLMSASIVTCHSPLVTRYSPHGTCHCLPPLVTSHSPLVTVYLASIAHRTFPFFRAMALNHIGLPRFLRLALIGFDTVPIFSLFSPFC